MDLNDMLIQTSLVILREGLSFVFSNLKDKKAAQKAEKDLEKEAETKAIKAIEQTVPALQNAPKWDKVATLFWLGNDLMWIQDMTYRAAPPDRVLQGVNIAIKYVEELGFTTNTLPYQDLILAREILESLIGFIPTTEEKRIFLEGHYRGIQQYVQTVKWYISALATLQQPGFEKLRVK
jgi:hypothetical protein